MDSEQFFRIAKALSDPTRFAILERIAAEGELGCQRLVEELPVSQPTVSHHLKVLRDAGAVTSERRGNWVFYSIAPNLMDRLGGIAQSLAPGGLIPASSLRRRTMTPRIASAAPTATVSPGAAAPP